MFEIKKIQQEDALERGYIFELMKQKGIDKDAAKKSFVSHENSLAVFL